MKRRIQLIIISGITIILLVIFYIYGSKAWGEIVYPLDYQVSIQKYTQQFGVDPNLVCAVIFSESHFNPKAVSGAGAEGLMQIMPATGRSIASDLGQSFGNLFDPDTNIEYGTFYLKGLLDKYPGRSDLAIAAYNAGVPRVDNYKDGVGQLPIETVGYISKIQSVESKYNEVYGTWYSKPVDVKVSKLNQTFSSVADFVRAVILGY
ncbi:MAG: lytic transglycosylase domain-containing protein [Patescibacteria group bacterium]|jgi:soluble lytic murein transglycosylase